MSDSSSSLFQRFEKVLSQNSNFRSVPRGLFRCRQVFEGVELRDRSVLEIGAGRGILSAYALAVGAAHVTALEPEAAGSTEGHVAGLWETAKCMHSDAFEVKTVTAQEFAPPNPHCYDIILMYNSINHLDEPTCAQLNVSEEARKAYQAFLSQIVGWTAEGGTWIVADCSRHNFWPTLNLSNPIARTIEWEKHQSPELWKRLLEPLELVPRTLEWHTFYPLRYLGPLAANRLASFMTTSHFRLTLTYK